jgi:hypothetical protein
MDDGYALAWGGGTSRPSLTGSKAANTFTLQTSALVSGGVLKFSAPDTAGIIRFDTGATNLERMRIDASGNVGIGTTTPNANLTVYNTGSTYGINLIGANNNNGAMIRSSYSVDPTYYREFGRNNSGGAFEIRRAQGGAATTDFAIDITGNVGIGTIAPTALLDIGPGSGSTGKININHTQVAYLPDQTSFAGSLFIGNGGSALSHSSGSEGGYNAGLGIGALFSNTTGQGNVAIGSSALYYNTTGQGNVAIGSSALYYNTTGNGNTANGGSALQSNTTGFQNTANGTGALIYNTAGYQNTANGGNALYHNTTGSNNVAIGYNAGAFAAGTFTDNRNSWVDTQSIFLGDYASRDVSVATTTALTNAIAIGYNAKVGCSNCMVLGSGVNVGIGTIAPSAQLHTTGSVRFANFGAGSLQTDASGNLSVSSDERLKDIQGAYTGVSTTTSTTTGQSVVRTAVEKILGIDPIVYRWNATSGMETAHNYVGFSAQNVQANIPEAVATDTRGYLTLSDRPILATLIDALKEIVDQITAIVVRLDANDVKIAELQQRVRMLEAREQNSLGQPVVDWGSGTVLGTSTTSTSTSISIPIEQASSSEPAASEPAPANDNQPPANDNMPPSEAEEVPAQAAAN